MSQFLDKTVRDRLHAECRKIAAQAAAEIGCTPKQLEELAKVEIKTHARRTGTSGTGNKTTVTINLHLNKDEDEYRDTLLHELAHSICDIKYPVNVGHGARWKTVMVMMGQEPNRCHTVSLAEAYPDKYRAFECVCGRKFEFSKRKLNKVKRGHHYRCRCGRRLDPLSKNEKRVAARAQRVTTSPDKHPYEMKCERCGTVVPITKRRRNIVLRGRSYTHNACGGKMVLK